MSDSDVEIKRIAPMKPVKKPPNSPTADLLKKDHEKKVTTKAMIHEALTELKTRKGVSIQAIKKFMEDKYNVETNKVKYLIKKALKTGIEDGSIVQVKGIGASGSFKLAPVKEKAKKKPKIKEDKSKKEKSTKEKSTKDKIEKIVKEKAKLDMPMKKVKIDVKDKDKKTEKPKDKKTEKSKDKKTEKATDKKIGKAKDKKKVEIKEKGKMKTAVTPAKKKATMMKRKSIGSIIKPPKMKPKSKA